jgi:phospholipid/cholesterol/gamma-HCH transport system substrate-binding protein
VAIGLASLGLVVFLVGDERRAFEKKEPYYVVFDDVQGLTRGAPVRMGGVDVGQVSAVGYGDDLKDSRLRVEMAIVRAEARRIREDSVATIGNKGLLGDKMVTIRVGSPERAELAPGSTLRSEPPQDLSLIADRLSAISEKAEVVMGNLQKTTATLAEPAMQEDIRTTARSLGNILKKVDEGDGYVARLLRDPGEADKMSRAVTSLESATGRLDKLLAGVDAAVARINHGPGLAHDLVYGDGPTEAVAQFGRAADELAKTLEGVRTGNGLARSVIYGDDQSQQLIEDLNAITRDVKVMVQGMKAGKGTLGALMVDPSVYEDLKLLLGNVERNKALRALVRYSIQKDERAPTVEVRDPGGAAAGASAGASRGAGSD